MRDERAHLAGLDVLLRHPSKWHDAAMAHLVQFVTFQEGKEPAWWLEFTGSAQSADLLISSSRVVSLNKLNRWIDKQVAVVLSVMYEVEGEVYFRDLIARAQKRDRSKYAEILELAG